MEDSPIGAVETEEGEVIGTITCSDEGTGVDSLTKASGPETTTSVVNPTSLINTGDPEEEAETSASNPASDGDEDKWKDGREDSTEGEEVGKGESSPDPLDSETTPTASNSPADDGGRDSETSDSTTDSGKGADNSSSLKSEATPSSAVGNKTSPPTSEVETVPMADKLAD